jgi:hypothetical protein
VIGWVLLNPMGVSIYTVFVVIISGLKGQRREDNQFGCTADDTSRKRVCEDFQWN